MTPGPRAEGEPTGALEGIGWGATPGDEEERLARIESELRLGFSLLHDVEPAVAFFGSARSAENASEYRLAHEVARAVARSGFNVLTGGGPGVMEAASRGCAEGGGLAVGLNIRLPQEQRPNRRRSSGRCSFVRGSSVSSCSSSTRAPS